MKVLFFAIFVGVGSVLESLGFRVSFGFRVRSFRAYRCGLQLALAAGVILQMP